jgi:site-specific recombinase XerD
MTPPAVGALLYAFFVDHLTALKGLRPASVQSYRDTLRLFLHFVATERGCRLTRLTVADLSFDRVLAFLRHLEAVRHNQIRTRNQRLAALHTFFEYLASTGPERLAVAQRVAAIPVKRCPPPETHFLERDQVSALFAGLPAQGRHAARDRALLLFLYNTGARVQEVSDLRRRDLDLGDPPRVRLHGKGDKWRTCPLWADTARQLQRLFSPDGSAPPDTPVFCADRHRPLTRFGIYKLVRRHTGTLPRDPTMGPARRIGPHIFRHTTAVHLLEAGVEVNVIRGWLGHVSLDTTNRYAELTVRAKEAALRTCEPPTEASAGFPRAPVWRDDETLLSWLASL